MNSKTTTYDPEVNAGGPKAREVNPFLFLVACAVFMLAGIMLLAWLGSSPVSSAVGKSLPNMNLSGLVNSDAIKVSNRLKDSVVVLYLWGPWNEESRDGFREFAELYRRFQGQQRIQFISVAFPKDFLDVEELRQQAQEATGDVNSEIPTYFDPEGQTSMELALLMPYGSIGFPTTMIADQTGKVTQVVEGYTPGTLIELEKFLRGSLKSQ